MKNLKIQFGLFSLLAVLAVSVFLTSCEQEAIIPESPAALSNQDMLNSDLEEYHSYLNSISKEDFEINEDVHTQINDLNAQNSQIQIANIIPLMKLTDDTDKAELLNILSNKNMVIGSGHVSSPKFSLFGNSDLIEITRELINTGKYAVIVDSKINNTSIQSIAIIGKKGIVWDNIYYLIDVREQTASEFQLSTEELKNTDGNLEKSGNGGCTTWRYKIDLGKNYFGGVVSTAFMNLELCWDCNGNFSENDSRIVNRYCTSLPGSACVSVGGVISGWGTNKIKVGIGGDYAPPGLSLGVTAGPVQLGFTPGNVSGLDAYGELFTYSGAISAGCNTSQSCISGTGWNETPWYGLVYVNDAYGNFPSWVWFDYRQEWKWAYSANDVCNGGIEFTGLVYDDREDMPLYVPTNIEQHDR